MGMDILSPFSFYGGKARMSSLICSMLDYDNTNIYVEPYGGACRVLLNKPRHEKEIYNDFGAGLYEFFYAMSKPELSEKVISALYDVTPDKELFYEMRNYKQEHENELMEGLQLRFKEMVYHLKQKYDSPKLGELHRLIIKKRYGEIIGKSVEVLGDKVIKDKQEEKAFQEYVELYLDYWNEVQEDYKDAYEEAEIAEGMSKEEEDVKRHQAALESIKDFTADTLISNDSEKGMDNVEMAVATYLTYYMSRDGMGKAYSEAKCSSLDAYYRQLLKLQDVADRFRDVEVRQMDALWVVAEYCQMKNAMLYLDPSYLNAEEEEEGKQAKKDLGKEVYNRSYDYEKHEELALMIQNEKAHIILSNYDVEPYKSILDEAHGWKRIEFETTTGVGNKKGNLRTEVLWYNY